jgi:hypothetical protein
MGIELRTPARVSFSSRKASTDSISSLEASVASAAASERKLERRRLDDTAIRSSLSEKQENHMKRVQKEYKETCYNLKETALSQYQESDELLAKEIKTRTVNNIEIL